MNIGTYQCENCSSKIEYTKEYGQEWPESFYCKFCEESSMKKLLTTLGGVTIPAGKLGNGKNSYTNTRKL